MSKQFWIEHSIVNGDNLIYILIELTTSLKKQYIAPKKLYNIDHVLVSKLALSFSRNQGRLLENLVFIELKRRGHDIYYYKTKRGREVDFITTEGKTANQLIQVCYDFSDQEVKHRETSALQDALDELNLENGLILTFDRSEDISASKHAIYVRPVWQWLLGVA